MSIYPWQQSQWQQLKQAYEQNRLPHALLFEGMAQLGKYDLALVLARMILCQNSPEHRHLFDAKTHPDLMCIGLSLDSKVIKTNDFKAWLTQSYLSPKLAQCKVMIINHAEKMTIQAANSFLKTLEEPAGNTIFILVTHGEKEILATIKSRCQRTGFQVPNHKEINQWLGIADADVWLPAANFSPLRLKLLLGDTNLQNQYRETMQMLTTMQAADVFKLSAKWIGWDALQIVQWWQSLIYMLLQKNLNPSFAMLGITKNLPQKRNSKELLHFYNKLLLARTMLTGSINTRLIMDDLLLSWLKIK